MPVNMNVFAVTEQDLYKDPFEKPKPKRSFDSLIQEFNSVRSAKADELRNQFWQLEAEIEKMLVEHRAGKLAELEEKLEMAILTSRRLQKAFASAHNETFEAFREYKRLERVAILTSKNHDNLTHDFKQKSLLTKSEKAEWAERIKSSKQSAEASFLSEINQQNVHNNLARAEAEAAKILQESVNVVNDIQREINRLSKETL